MRATIARYDLYTSVNAPNDITVSLRHDREKALSDFEKAYLAWAATRRVTDEGPES